VCPVPVSGVLKTYDGVLPVVGRNVGRNVCYRILLLLSLAMLVVGMLGSAAKTTVVGKVVGVHDGDTLTLLTDENQRVKVRLAEIDAQSWGSRMVARPKKYCLTLCLVSQSALIRRVLIGTDECWAGCSLVACIL